jgi:hypothetical protein
VERFELNAREGRFTFPADAEPAHVVIDPRTWVLMEPPVFAKR